MDSRRPTRELSTPPPTLPDLDAHRWGCWGATDGPGTRRLAEIRRDAAIEKERVQGELTALAKRSWYQSGGTAAVTALGLLIFAAWLSARFSETKLNSVTREDVTSAIQKSFEMSSARRGDDLMLLKQMIDGIKIQVQAPIQYAKPPTAARK
jgi:hypothetical protein